nr:MAG TPA: hypothetical protein [Caudoviricetes sp.]
MECASFDSGNMEKRMSSNSFCKKLVQFHLQLRLNILTNWSIGDTLSLQQLYVSHQPDLPGGSGLLLPIHEKDYTLS